MAPTWAVPGLLELRFEIEAKTTKLGFLDLIVSGSVFFSVETFRTKRNVEENFN